MDIKFFVPYVEAKKRLDIRASIVGRWLEAGSYEDRRGDGVWRRVRTSRMNRDFSVWLLDFKSRGRLVRTEVAPGRRRYGIVPDIDPGEIPDLKELPYVAGTQSVQHDAETDSYYEVGEAGLLSVRRGYSDYMDYRFNRRSGELVLPEGRMLVMRLDEEVGDGSRPVRTGISDRRAFPAIEIDDTRSRSAEGSGDFVRRRFRAVRPTGTRNCRHGRR